MENRFMTNEEINVWEGIIAQCKRGNYSSINVASKKRSAVILKIDSLIADIDKTCESIGYYRSDTSEDQILAP